MQKNTPSSREARIATGRKFRARISRISQAELAHPKRNFDPVKLLLESDEGRLPKLLPRKYELMAVSPFGYFRGAVAAMAADLARLPHSGINVQLCGDAHVQNLGSFAAPNGSLVFDFNDFDETIPGPWEWDVKRMATSIVLAGRESGHKPGACQQAAADFVENYRRFVQEFSSLPILEVARHQIHREERIQPVSAALKQSRRASPNEAMKAMLEPDSAGKLRFRDGRPAFWRVKPSEAKPVLESLEAYRHSLRPESRHLFDLFRPFDVAFKVVGTGSVGLRDYVVAMEGNSAADPLFLQIKQEMPSAYARYLHAGPVQNEGKRTAEGQRSVQPLSDLLLGWTSIGGNDFLVRQMNDHKGRIELADLRRDGLKSLANVAGELLARGHARSGDACLIAGYCGSGSNIAKAIARFAVDYADLTESDYKAFVARKSERVSSSG